MPRNLSQLDLDLSFTRGELSRHPLLFSLTERLRNLQVLHLVVRHSNIDCISRLSNLKHLRLLTDKDVRYVLTDNFGSLHNLQTLYVHALHPDSVCALLLLGCMSHMQSVSLINVVPAALSLAEGTDLHVELHRLQDTHKNVWYDNMSNLRSVRLSTWTSIEEKDLPDFLFEPLRLDVLDICASRFGTDRNAILLRGAFLSCQNLRFGCESVHAIIPDTGFVWSRLCVSSMDTLDVRFMSVQSFVEGCPAAGFSFDSLKGRGLMELCQHLQQSAADWYLGESSGDEGGSVVVYPGSVANTVFHPICVCGACQKCLGI